MVLQAISNTGRRDAPLFLKPPASLGLSVDSEMSSRTAALSRYLAALDSPVVNPSLATGSELNSRVSVSSEDLNEFETPFTNGNTDLYSGHKVVAMPSLGGKSVREVVSSREPPITNTRRAATPSQQRSRSAGRTPQSKSRDIVQDVYDRMGVSRDDLGGDKDKFQIRYRAAAALTAATEAQPRGRTMEQQPVSTDGQRRARSLSRGRSVAGRWPPTRHQDEREQRAVRESAPERAVSSTEVRIDPTRRQVIPQQTKQSLVSAVDDANRLNRASSFPIGSSSMQKKTVSPRKPTELQQVTAEDQGDDKSGANSTEGISNLSVKDRVTAITGGKSNRNFPKRSIPVQYVKRPPPPKIDIYEEIRRKEEDESEQTAPEPSTIPPSPAAAAAADAAAELVRKNQYGRPHHTRSPSMNDKSDPYNTPVSKPPLEISGVDDSGGLADSSSVAISSVSADEYNDRSPSQLPGKKDPVTRRWNGVSQRSTLPSPASAKSFTSAQSVNNEHLDRIVEERVQAQISELETRMTSQMLRLERRMEERMQDRMDQLESKIDKIGSMLSAILSHQKEI